MVKREKSPGWRGINDRLVDYLTSGSQQGSLAFTSDLLSCVHLRAH